MSVAIWLSYRLVRVAGWLNPELLPLLLESAERLGVVGYDGKFYQRAKALGEQNQ